jgi:hypothetical protein
MKKLQHEVRSPFTLVLTSPPFLTVVEHCAVFGLPL